MVIVFVDFLFLLGGRELGIDESLWRRATRYLLYHVMSCHVLSWDRRTFERVFECSSWQRRHEPRCFETVTPVPHVLTGLCLG